MLFRSGHTVPALAQKAFAAGRDLMVISVGALLNHPEVIERARAAIQPLVEQRVIRTGIDISTPERLFALAGFAEQLVPAQKALQNAIAENVAATNALAQKDWNVYVQVPGASPAPVPLPRT